MEPDGIDIIKLREDFELNILPKVDGRKLRSAKTKERKRIESLNKLLNRTDYGRVQEIRKMRYEKLMTLQEIADFYSLSRERIRQILKSKDGREIQHARAERSSHAFQDHPELTNKELSSKMGVTYAYISHQRRGMRHAIEPGSNIYKGTYAEDLVNKKLTEAGIPNKLMPHGYKYDIETDTGIRIDVKAVYTEFTAPSIKTRNPHTLWCFNSEKRRRGNYADFFILVVVPLDAVFIIPFSEVKERVLLTWPHARKVTRYEKYHNAFHLLKTDS